MEKEEYFCVTSVARADLEGSGYDTSNVDDATMQQLADKMGEAYCDNGFWIALPIIVSAVTGLDEK